MTTPMATNTAGALLDGLEEVREARQEWIERWEAYRRSLRHCG